MEDNSACWLFVDAKGDQKGPMGASVIMNLLKRGIGLASGVNTLVWRQGMEAWQPLMITPPFAETAQMSIAQWHYVDSEDKESKGPIPTVQILEKLAQGEIHEETMVFCPAFTVPALPTVPGQQGQQPASWMAVRDVSALMAAHLQNKQETEARDKALRPEADSEQFAQEAPGGNSTTTNSNTSTNTNSNTGSSSTTGSSSRNRRAKHDKNQETTWVEVGNLPVDVTKDELHDHFMKVGLISTYPSDQTPKIKLYPDEDLQHVTAAVCYHARPSVRLSVDILDGSYLRAGGETITVKESTYVAASKTTKPKVSNQPDNANANPISNANGTTNGADEGAGTAATGTSVGGKRKGGAQPYDAEREKARARGKVAKAALTQALSWNEDDDSGTTGEARSSLRIVVLEGMFSPVELLQGAKNEDDKTAFELELEEDVYSECSKHGTVEKITLFARNPNGILAIKFSTAFSAQACIKDFNGRFFGGNKVRAFHFDGVTDYGSGWGGISALSSSSSSSTAATNANTTAAAGSTTTAGANTTGTTTGAGNININTNQTSTGTGASSAADDGYDSAEEEEKREKARLESFGNWLDQEQEELPEEFKLSVEK